ncbi:hypothetical protein BWI15_26785 [Kribbella sp. ALI-6-A]|uniref:hypothetical protein n=1 Tax=Kribbella sp. ALI-6-A TaxID=1933817 RepID=UPI00097C575D|nr:hypothetical protein [Kribbella sp. ALI-6-A]ONI66806.1 hypothetical protein BWI15_26785 [Kribbella sp. ALI-6-A]
MNDNELRDLLRAGPDKPSPLDPSRVIAGAHRRRRTRVVLAAGFTSLAVGAVVAGGISIFSAGGGAEPFGPPVAGQPSVAPSANSARPRNGFVFQNSRPAIGQLPADASVRIAPHYSLKTRGTQWAVISQVPGEAPYEPFGWRATVGNTNLGDGTSPGVQSLGIGGKSQLVSSVFNCPEAATVVYTSGTRAWYAKVYRLGGIQGWVASSAIVTGSATGSVTPGPKDEAVSVFAYDAQGELLTSFGGGKNPLAN